MTKILIDRATAEQTLEALDSENPDIQLKAALALRTVLEQQQAKPVQEPVAWITPDGEGFRIRFSLPTNDVPLGWDALYTTPPLPVQKPVACRFCFSEKGCWTWQCHNCGEIDDVQQPTPQQQQAGSVSMRMPKVGDKVICLEDESLGEVVSLTAGGSPDIKFADGSRGTYMVREFAELFGYVNSPQQQAKPVTWDRPSASFNEWWDSDRHDNANPFEKDSAAYWAWAGWKAAQRPLVGLEAEDLAQIESDEFWQVGNHMAIAMAVEAKLKELNK